MSYLEETTFDFKAQSTSINTSLAEAKQDARTHEHTHPLDHLPPATVWPVSADWWQIMFVFQTINYQHQKLHYCSHQNKMKTHHLVRYLQKQVFTDKSLQQKYPSPPELTTHPQLSRWRNEQQDICWRHPGKWSRTWKQDICANTGGNNSI